MPNTKSTEGPASLEKGHVAANAEAAKSANSKKRLAWVDVAKGIAIVLVITGHTIQMDSPLRPVIFMFHMPLFFIMAGYTFKLRSLKDELITSAKRLLIPYLLLFFIWNGVEWLKRPDAFTGSTIGEFFLRMIFASGSENVDMGITAVGMAWFLMCLFVSKVLLNVLLTLFKRTKCHLAIQAVVFLVLAFVGAFLDYRWHIFLPFDLDIAFVTVGFMWCGYLARQKGFFERVGMRWYVVVAALVVFVVAIRFGSLELATRAYGGFPLCLLGALAGSYLACWVSRLIERFSKLLTRFFAFLGRNSMLIYCFHCIDWLIPWATLPALEGVPFRGLITSILRTAYAILLTVLVRRV